MPVPTQCLAHEAKLHPDHEPFSVMLQPLMAEPVDVIRVRITLLCRDSEGWLGPEAATLTHPRRRHRMRTAGSGCAPVSD